VSVSVGRGTALAGRLVDRVGFHGLALAGVLLLTFSYTSVLYHVTDVVGGAPLMVVVVVGMLAVATALGRTLHERAAVGLTVGLVVLGTLVYFGSIPQSQLALLTAGRLVADAVALLTGLSVLRLTKAGIWALVVAPAPVFLSWHLALRERYVPSVLVGSTALGLLVLTGDAGDVATLVGVVGATVAVAFGALDTYGGTAAQVDTIAIVVAAMVAFSALLSVVPAGATGAPLLPDRGSPTVEASLVNAGDQIDILGSIRLSPEVRFSIQSTEESYWQTNAYDRYTANGWSRTGEADPYVGQLPSPPGAYREVEQTVSVETGSRVMPAAWKPVRVSGAPAERALVTPQGTLQPDGTLGLGDTYSVRSRVPQHTSEQLRRAGSDYPDRVAEQYLQLPGSVSDRVRQRAAEVAGGEDNAYDKAVAVESYLERAKEYSLTVERPDGEITDAFLFEMDAGYCTYYATAMVTMLRSEGVPARFVTGYTPGQEVGENEYVVRGLDSHAWVQVYFPEVGWVNFDPTPAGPRRTAENARLTEARENDETGVDTALSEGDGFTPTPDRELGNRTAPNASSIGQDTPPGLAGEDVENTTAIDQLGPGDVGAADGQNSGGGGGFELPELPDRETLGFMFVVFVGLAAGARRTGLSARAAEAIRLRVQPSSDDPETDVDRAFDRLERFLAREYRPRRDGETPRAYLESLRGRGLDDRAVAVGDVYERARYGRGVTRAEADEAISAVNDLVWEATPLIRRVRG
jgi:transglutaminase-like putative cysteine protease